MRIHVAGIDLIRDEHGTLRVLEDNLRCPSGVSYVLENRRTMAHVVPELFDQYSIRSIEEYLEQLYKALRASAPIGIENPTIVVLTPGVHNSAHFEHAFLSRRMGVELVEGRDLFCRNNTLYMRTSKGSAQVDVVYRRIDDDFLDPVQFKPDSVLGVPGLLNAARAGNVTIANAVGNGIADDKALYPYVPELIKFYLGEEAILPNVETYNLQDREQLAHVVANIEKMVVKLVAGSGGYGITIGPRATQAELRKVVEVIKGDPRNWVAQPMVPLSTCPTVQPDGSIASRHIDLRPFAVNDGKNIWVLPGGITRVALVEGNVVVNSSQGGGSKDTWVLSTEADQLDHSLNEMQSLDVAEEAILPPSHGPEVVPITRMRQQEEQQQQC